MEKSITMSDFSMYPGPPSTKVKRGRETLNQIKTQTDPLGAGGGAAHGLRAWVVDVG